MDNTNNKNKIQQNNKVYIALLKRFEGEIPKSYLGSNHVIIGYTNKWLAIASIVPKTSIQRGTLQPNHRPYLKELQINGFAGFNVPCYIYELKGGNKLDEYRHEIKNTEFCNRFYISNMYDELIRNNVKMDKFKY